MHTEPGPMPTFTMSAPLRINSSVISFVTTLPAMRVCVGHRLRVSRTACALKFTVDERECIAVSNVGPATRSRGGLDEGLGVAVGHVETDGRHLRQRRF